MSAKFKGDMRGSQGTSTLSTSCVGDHVLRDALTAHYSDLDTDLGGSELGSDCSSSDCVSSSAGSFLTLKGARAVACDSSYVERKRKSAMLDEHLDGLRAVLPDGASRNKERTTIVLDAYHYIANLQRQVEDLKDELVDDATSDSAHSRPEELYCDAQWSASYHGGQPGVDVVTRNGLLDVRIVCANRPGLLVDIMEAIESAGLTIMYTRIARHNGIVVEHLSLEANEDSQDAEGEEERVKTLLLRAIGSHLQ